MTPVEEQARATYAIRALSQIPRILGNQDRSPFSPTYGCFHRDYWLDKTSDFPDALRQFGVQSLALVYAHDFPGNIYKGKVKVRDWAIAGMEFWAKIQHTNGSFDEFYPFERGWVGPTAFTTYTVIEAFKLLESEMTSDQIIRIRHAIRKAAHFIARGESEEDHLANHHAIASLTVRKAFELLREPELEAGFRRLWSGFLNYYDREGWCREYDGIDPGYLSATVSFLAKIYQTHPMPEILEVARASIETCGYFLYPNNFYAGSLGSRNTLHFYPHGFEIFARQIPMAAPIASKALEALSEGKLVPPEIMSDRYVFYRVPEYLQSYLDYAPRPPQLPPLPYEREPFQRYYPRAKIWIQKTRNFYAVANLAKGGVFKVFRLPSGELAENDCGIIATLTNGKIMTTQWIDPEFHCRVEDNGWEVSGNFRSVPGFKLFTPIKLIVFRMVLLLIGWNSYLSHRLKGWIRKTLILGSRRAPADFRRTLHISGESILITQRMRLSRDIRIRDLLIGGEFFMRYVPQSRYFQSQELDIKSEMLSPDELEQLQREGSFERSKEIK